jgi:hypothetical protein
MRAFAKCLTQILRRWPASIVALIVALNFVAGGMHTSAQSGAGSIEGTVTDSTGAVIPGAAIRVVNVATGVAVNTITNGVGFYQAPNLFAGTYTVTVKVAAMKTAESTVRLLAAQSAEVEVVMVAGEVTQRVEVSANFVQLTTNDSGTIASTLENERINQLPMNGRVLLNLAQATTPGLEAGGTRVNGLMAEALEYVADGVPLTNRNFGGEGNSTQAQLPDPDSVQEVRLETTNTSAMYAAPATGIITTKSGTNSLHGSVFETARNNAIGLAKRRQDLPGFAAPHLVRNEFGASVGGPIVLPKLYHGKDKSFWFLAYERYSLAQITYQQNYSYTPAMRNGDWSNLYNSAGVFQQLYDPNTTASSQNCNGTGSPNTYCRAPFANNQLPISRLSPTTKKLFAITPLPTTNDNPLVTTNLTAPNPTYNVIPNISFRLDHSFDENNKAYARYTGITQNNSSLRNNPINPGTIAAEGIPAGASGFQNVVIGTYGGGIGYTHVFSPTFYSETIASQNWQSQYFVGGASLNYAKMLGLPNNFGTPGFPDINSSGFGNLFGTQWAYGYSQIISNLDENLSKTVGRQQIQFGGRYRHERFGYLPDQSHDTVTFNGYATALENPASGTNLSSTSNTGNTDADYFLGAASNYNVNKNAPYIHFHDMEFDVYAQDNIHVNRSLTINIGLRYEAHPAPWLKYGMANGFDLKNHAIVLSGSANDLIGRGYTTQAIMTNLQNIGARFETPEQAGLPSTIVRNYNMTFGPRLGIAYQPVNGKYGTVIRGAYGRYIYPVPIRSQMINMVKNLPFTATYNQSYTAANQSPDGKANYLLRAPQSVVMGVNSSGVVNTDSINSILPGQGFWALSPNYAPDYVTQTNVTVEQAFKGDSALRVTWLYTHGTNLDRVYYPNSTPSLYVWESKTGQPQPTGSLSSVAMNPYDAQTWGSISWDAKNGWSNDNALQAAYQRLYHKGVAYQIAYTWSKPFRVGGNWSRDGMGYTTESYASTGGLGVMTQPYGQVLAPALPPARPAGIAPYEDYHALARYADYIVDTAIPKQHITFSGILDLPFGTGKRFFGNSGRMLNELIGGFQIAGLGSVVSQDFAVNSSYWGPTNPLKLYKHGAPVTDCRSGVCHKAYEWFNGYIAPTAISGNACATTNNLVFGLPSSWAPYSAPSDTNCNKANPANQYYNKDEVAVTLLNGTTVPVAYSPGPAGANPYSHTVLNGPINYNADLSIFKVFPITERVNLRVNMDAFNAFNIQGFTNPNTTDGIQQVEPGSGSASSYNPPRQVQFTMRLSF